MLRSQDIPQHDDDSLSWQRFLYKAAKGSEKAHYWLWRANTAYMVTLTGDASAPDGLPLDEYSELFRRAFPESPPFRTMGQLIDFGVRIGWFPDAVSARGAALHDGGHYTDLWERRTSVDEVELVHDSILASLESWSPECAIACLDENPCRYNARVVVSGMLYLCLTWPSGPFAAV